jgi:hypothetical protein
MSIVADLAWDWLFSMTHHQLSSHSSSRRNDGKGVVNTSDPGTAGTDTDADAEAAVSETGEEELTLWLASSFLSISASLAAVARLPRLASESLATPLLASLEAVAPVPWTVSET